MFSNCKFIQYNQKDLKMPEAQRQHTTMWVFWLLSCRLFITWPPRTHSSQPSHMFERRHTFPLVLLWTVCRGWIMCAVMLEEQTGKKGSGGLRVHQTPWSLQSTVMFELVKKTMGIGFKCNSGFIHMLTNGFPGLFTKFPWPSILWNLGAYVKKWENVVFKLTMKIPKHTVYNLKWQKLMRDNSLIKRINMYVFLVKVRSLAAWRI